MTETEESQLLVDAEMRRRNKAARIQVVSATTQPADTLNAALGRLQALSTKPICKEGTDDKPERIKKLRDDAGIPKRHALEIPHEQSPWQVKRSETVQKIGSGFLIAIVGLQGTGKTQMGAALIHDATARLLSCKFASAMRFFIDLKSTFDDGAESRESAILARYTKPKLLVLDEMDERSESAWENRLLFHMLNERYNAMLDTFLISRRTQQEFLSSVGLSIQSRLQETGGVIVCNWPSWRER